MKTHNRNLRAGLTLLEILVVVAMLAIVAVFLLRQMRNSKQMASPLSCVNNLKQVGLAFRIYAGDNSDRYPMNLSTNDKPVVNETTLVYQYLQLISNELGTPKGATCPKDIKRRAANDFTNFSNSNISYFIGLDSNENLPQTMLAGDRNITNGFAPQDGLLEITTNQMVGFTDEIHLKQGNIALGDGSVQQVSSARLRSEIISNTGMATNRIKLP